MLSSKIIHNAFSAMGVQLTLDHDVEILVVGGAAGLLTGELPASWTTQDVDLLHCHLARDRDAVLDAAAIVTRRLSLPPAWMNDFGGLYAWSIPERWQTRRLLVGSFGRLKVYAIGRPDLIAMKFVAHRTRDLEHLLLLKVTLADLEFTRRHLARLTDDYPEHMGQIELACDIVKTWNAGK